MELEKMADYHINRGEIGDGFNLLRRSLDVYRKLYGPKSIEFRKIFDEIIVKQNQKGLLQMNQGKLGIAYRILKHVETLCALGSYTDNVNYKIIVFNHVGCCLRRMGKLGTALKYLLNAMKLIKASGVFEEYPSTCLNLCAIYRQRGEHSKAIKLAKKACDEFSHQIITMTSEEFDDDEDYKVKYAEKVKLLAISYHNLGVEQEFRGKKDKACNCFKKAYQLMQEKFGDDNAFTKKFKRNYELKIKNREYDDIDLRRVKSLRRNQSGILAYRRSMPEWKVSESPYSKKVENGVISKYHRGCIPKLHSIKARPIGKLTRRPNTRSEANLRPKRSIKINRKKKKKKKKKRDSYRISDRGQSSGGFFDVKLKADKSSDDEEEGDSKLGENRKFVIKKMNNFMDSETKKQRLGNARDEVERIKDKKRDEASRKLKERQKEKENLLKKKRKDEAITNLLFNRSAAVIQKKYVCHMEAKNDKEQGFESILEKYFKIERTNKDKAGLESCHAHVLSKDNKLKFFLRREKNPRKCEILDWIDGDLAGNSDVDECTLRVRKISKAQMLIGGNIKFNRKQKRAFKWIEEPSKVEQEEKRKESEIDFGAEDDFFGIDDDFMQSEKSEKKSEREDETVFEDPNDGFEFLQPKNDEKSSPADEKMKSSFDDNEFNFDELDEIKEESSKPLQEPPLVTKQEPSEFLDKQEGNLLGIPESGKPKLPKQKSLAVQSAYDQLEKERLERIKELKKDPQLISSVLTIQRYTRGNRDRTKFLQEIRERLSHLIFYQVRMMNNINVLITFRETPTEFIVNSCGVRENKVFKQASVSKDIFDCPEEVLEYMYLEEGVREIMFYEKKFVYDQQKIKKIQNWWQRIKLVKWLRLNISESSNCELIGRKMELINTEETKHILAHTCYYYRDLDKLEFRLVKKGSKVVLDVYELDIDEFKQAKIFDLGKFLLREISVKRNPSKKKRLEWGDEVDFEIYFDDFESMPLMEFRKPKKSGPRRKYSKSNKKSRNVLGSDDEEDTNLDELEITDKEVIIKETILILEKTRFTVNLYRTEKFEKIILEAKIKYSSDPKCLDIDYVRVNLEKGTPMKNVKRHIDKAILSCLGLSKVKRRPHFSVQPWHRHFDWSAGSELDSLSFEESDLNLSNNQLNQIVNGNESVSELSKEDLLQDLGEEEKPEGNKSIFDDMDSPEPESTESIHDSPLSIESPQDLEKSIESQDYEGGTSAWRRVAKKIVKSKFSWKQIFTISDKFNTGSLNVFTIINAFVNEFGVSLRDATRVTKDIDDDLNGTVTIEEWVEKSSKFIDNVHEIKDIVITYDEFKDILYIKLMNDEVIWEALFLENNDKKETRSVMSLTDNLQWRLDLPKHHLYRFIKAIDINRNGFISHDEWINAYNCNAFSNDKYRYLLRGEDYEEKKIKPFVPDYTFNKNHFKLAESDIIKEAEKRLEEESFSGLSDIDEEKGLDIEDAETKIVIEVEKQGYEKESIDFWSFIKKNKVRFRPDSFFKRRLSVKQKREKNPKISIFRLVNEIFGEFPEIKRDSLVKIIKEKDRRQTGFISIQVWREICGEDPSPFNFIKDQIFNFEEFKEDCKNSVKTLLESFKGFNDILTSVFLEIDYNKDNVVSLAALSSSLHSVLPEVPARTIFLALSTMTSFKSVFVNFHEFAVSLNLSNKEIWEHLDYIRMQDVEDTMKVMEKKLKRLSSLKKELIENNFNFLDAFEESRSAKDPSKALAMGLVRSMKVSLAEKSENLKNLSYFIRMLDGDRSGFIDEYAWEYFFSPVVKNAGYPLDKNFKVWSNLAIQNLNIEIGTPLRVVYDYFKVSSRKSELQLKKFELSFLALKKFIEVHKVTNDEVVGGFLDLL